MSHSNSKAHCGPTQQTEAHVKHEEARQLRAEIEAFKARGGKIEVLGNTPRRDLHDYKKAEKGRKGGKKNSRAGISALFEQARINTTIEVLPLDEAELLEREDNTVDEEEVDEV